MPKHEVRPDGRWAPIAITGLAATALLAITALLGNATVAYTGASTVALVAIRGVIKVMTGLNSS
jgi:hypothetical protein